MPAGLRVSEVVLLKIADIDSGRMLIRIEHGKGGRDRYVRLAGWWDFKPFPNCRAARPGNSPVGHKCCAEQAQQIMTERPETHTSIRNS
jgi:hypothetical protein